MEITRDEGYRKELLNQIAKREFSERSGVHCTDLIYCLNKQANRKLHPAPDSEADILRFSLGWSTQRWLTGKDEDEAPIERDGIIVTLDALADGTPWELKATYQSSNKDVSSSLNWIRQIMCQCYVTGTTTAKLSRLELMGNWKRTEEHPTLSAFRLDFEQSELDRFWSTMQIRRDQYLEILKTKILLPKALALLPGSDYECAWACPLVETCQ